MACISRSTPVAKAIAYLLNDWPGFTAFLHDGRICFTKMPRNASCAASRGAEKAWLFVGSDRDGERTAIMYTLISTARLCDIDPLAWLTDVLARIADIPQRRLHELRPWKWKELREGDALEMAA